MSMPSLALPGGYAVTLHPDHSYELVNAKAKPLASVPRAVRTSPEWARVVALRDSHAARLAQHRLTVAGWMLSAEALPVDVLTELFADPSWSEPLTGLLVQADTSPGFLLEAATDGLLLADGRMLTTGTVVLLHPASTPALDTWRSQASSLGIRQGIPQLARPVVTPAEDEAPARTSKRFSARTLNSAVRASYAFNALGWTTTGGTARRSVAIHDGAAERFTVAFEYFADGEFYGDWNQECQTGALTFSATDDEPLRMREVPPALFSEACLDITNVLRRIGA
jgi:hypothetical protein